MLIVGNITYEVVKNVDIVRFIMNRIYICDTVITTDGNGNSLV